LPAPDGVKRTPVYLESRGQWLFAWLHWREQVRSDHGILLCPPVGHEQIHAHRSLRHLADAAARAGFPVLRLDYHGTGDSAGTEDEPDRYATWLANLRDAQIWLREQLGCRRITLIGLRLGATLAAQAAAAQDVDGLVLWAPVVKGRAYVRELRALSSMAGGGDRPAPGTPGDLEVAGFVLTEQTARDLSGLDLLKSEPRCRRALIVARDDMPADAALQEHLRARGIEVEQTLPPGYADMMAEPHFTKVPHEAIAQVVAWLRAASAGAADAAPEETTFVAQAILAHEPAAGSPRIREESLYINDRPALFGIVSEPHDTPAAPLPFLVLLNAGSCYHVGPNRLYVSLSRVLAARGFRCLRMDLCGLGDSETSDPERENDPYPATTFRDIDRTLKHLRTHWGAERLVLLGLCSGAYAAFQSAARLTDPVLVESVLINPLTFYWHEGMSLGPSPAEQLQSYRACLRSLWQPKKWLKLLSGKSQLGVAGLMRLLMGRRRGRGRAGRGTAFTGGPSDVPMTHPVREDLPGDLERIAGAGRQLACFFAKSDPGHALLTDSALRQVNDLCTAGRMSVAFIEDADHTFSRLGPRRALVQAITEYLSRRYLPASGL
jgi:alpha-beta hydrolase superfamily lysophospholipase